MPAAVTSSTSPWLAKRAVTDIVAFSEACLQQSVPACGMTDGGITMLFDCEGSELRTDFALMLWLRYNGTGNQCSQGMQHVTAHSFRANIQYVVTTSNLMSSKNF